MKFGQYELLERVAVGGMAEVYRGRVAGAEGFEKWVAIKRILPEFSRDDRFISMMLTEARIHSALSHGNIVQIHDLGISEDGEYFIVLEYVEGHDLRAVMEAASELGVQIPDSLALHIAYELAQALHFAHELTDPEGQPLGIIHRDVSPSNVLISNSGEVKLSDFGIAKRRHEHSFVGSLKGNLVYMSPEQAQRVTLDRRTDVFSLGAVLFEMLTGQKLRDITDDVNGFREVASGVVRSARALRPDLPEAYEALLSRALAANPADRFPDAAAFGAAIRELGRGSDAPVGPADVKELVELLNPPRRARSPVERSKVIRLGPEFKVLAGPSRGARAGGFAEISDGPGGGHASGYLAPGVVPAQSSMSKSNGNGGPMWADGAARLAAVTPPPLSTMAATPPPPVLLGPAVGFPAGRYIGQPRATEAPVTAGQRAAAEAAAVAAAAAEAAAAEAAVDAAVANLVSGRDMQATPPPPSTAEVTTPLATSRPFERSITRPMARPILRPIAHPIEQAIKRAMEHPVPPVESPASELAMSMSMPTPPPVPGAYARPPSGPHRAALQPAAVVPVAEPLRASAPMSINRQFMPGAAATTAIIARDFRWGPWRSIVVLLLLGLSVTAAVVHYKFIPLDVVAVWFKPAWLLVSSEPSGANLTLDGRALPDRTPARIEVRRDRGDHVLELTRPGSRPVRTTLRFDRTVELSLSISLPAEPPPPPPPPPVETKPAAPPAPPVAAAKPTPTEAKAEKKADKAETKAAKAAKTAKKAAKKKAKKKADKKAAKKADKKADKKAAKKASRKAQKKGSGVLDSSEL